jgi:hypothetical protein
MNSPADLTAQPFRVGDIEVLTIPDGSNTFPLPDSLVRNANRSQVNTALEAAGMKRDERLQSGFVTHGRPRCAVRHRQRGKRR